LDAIKILSAANLDAPYKFIGAAALSVLSAMALLTSDSIIASITF
jgi:hypothetical protein